MPVCIYVSKYFFEIKSVKLLNLPAQPASDRKVAVSVHRPEHRAVLFRRDPEVPKFKEE